MRLNRNVVNRIQKTIPVLVLLAAWIILTEYKLVRPLFLPSPKNLLDAFKMMAPQLPKAIGISMSMILTGFLIGSVFGIVSSMVMAYSRMFLNMFGSIFDFMRPIPVFALIPMFVLWFGIGRTPQIALIALGCSVTMGVTTTEAIRNIPNIYIEAARTLGANRIKVFTSIVVPYIIPHIIGAIRLAAATSFGLDVAAEFMGSQTGLGYLMIVQQQYLRTSGILVIVIIYSTFAIVVDRLIAAIERRATVWTTRSGKSHALDRTYKAAGSRKA
ncbi:MAG: ABC transporter permease [Saccharofermentanales bacterium]